MWFGLKDVRTALYDISLGVSDVCVGKYIVYQCLWRVCQFPQCFRFLGCHGRFIRRMIPFEQHHGRFIRRPDCLTSGSVCCTMSDSEATMVIFYDDSLRYHDSFPVSMIFWSASIMCSLFRTMTRLFSMLLRWIQLQSSRIGPHTSCSVLNLTDQ